MAYKTLDGQVLFLVRYVSLKYEERVSFSQSTWLYTCSVCFKSNWRSWRDTGSQGFRKWKLCSQSHVRCEVKGQETAPMFPRRKRGPRDTERRGKEPSSAGRCRQPSHLSTGQRPSKTIGDACPLWRAGADTPWTTAVPLPAPHTEAAPAEVSWWVTWALQLGERKWAEKEEQSSPQLCHRNLPSLST